MSKLLALLVAAAVGMCVLVSSAGANNDPHRFPAYTDVDLPASWCGFPVHVATVVSKQYLSVLSMADGSVVYKTTGMFVGSFTNTDTHKTIAVKANGPSEGIYATPDSTSWTYVAEGDGILYAANLTDYGFPSNVVLTSGLIRSTMAMTGDESWFGVTSLTRMPRITLDVCAALAP